MFEENKNILENSIHKKSELDSSYDLISNITVCYKTMRKYYNKHNCSGNPK